MFLLSSSGLAPSTTRSASLPGSTVPSLAPAPTLAAGTALAAVSACSGVRPAPDEQLELAVDGQTVKDRGVAGVGAERNGYAGGMGAARGLQRAHPRRRNRALARLAPPGPRRLQAVEDRPAHGAFGAVILDVAVVAVVRELVEEAQRGRPEHSPFGRGRDDGLQHLVVTEHHVLQPVDAGLDTVGRLLGSGHMGEDRSAQDVRVLDERVEDIPAEPRHVAGNGAVDDLDDVDIVVDHETLELPAPVGGIADLERDAAEPSRFSVENGADGMAAGRGEDGARGEDARRDERPLALSRSSGEDDALVVADAHHRGDAAAQVGAPVPEPLLLRELLGPHEASGAEDMVDVRVPETGQEPPPVPLDDPGAGRTT